MFTANVQQTKTARVTLSSNECPFAHRNTRNQYLVIDFWLPLECFDIYFHILKFRPLYNITNGVLYLIYFRYACDMHAPYINAPHISLHLFSAKSEVGFITSIA